LPLQVAVIAIRRCESRFGKHAVSSRQRRTASCQLVLMIDEYIDMLVSFTVPTSHSAKVIRLIDT